MSICTITDCKNGTYARGWCHKHYGRWQRHGDPHILLSKGRRRGVHRLPSDIKSMTDIEAAQVGRMIDTDGWITRNKKDGPFRWAVAFKAITLPQLTHDLQELTGGGGHVVNLKKGMQWRTNRFLSVMDLLTQISPWSYKAQKALGEISSIS